jgi:hypothetical protein
MIKASKDDDGDTWARPIRNNVFSGDGKPKLRTATKDAVYRY